LGAKWEQTIKTTYPSSQCFRVFGVEVSIPTLPPPLHSFQQRCACRKLRPCWSGGVVVLVEDAAQPLSSADAQVDDLGLVGDRWWQWV